MQTKQILNQDFFLPETLIADLNLSTLMTNEKEEAESFLSDVKIIDFASNCQESEDHLSYSTNNLSKNRNTFRRGTEQTQVSTLYLSHTPNESRTKLPISNKMASVDDLEIINYSKHIELSEPHEEKNSDSHIKVTSIEDELSSTEAEAYFPVSNRLGSSLIRAFILKQNSKAFFMESTKMGNLPSHCFSNNLNGYCNYNQANVNIYPPTNFPFQIPSMSPMPMGYNYINEYNHFNNYYITQTMNPMVNSMNFMNPQVRLPLNSLCIPNPAMPVNPMFSINSGISFQDSSDVSIKKQNTTNIKRMKQENNVIQFINNLKVKLDEYVCSTSGSKKAQKILEKYSHENLDVVYEGLEGKLVNVMTDRNGFSFFLTFIEVVNTRLRYQILEDIESDFVYLSCHARANKCIKAMIKICKHKEEKDLIVSLITKNFKELCNVITFKIRNQLEIISFKFLLRSYPLRDIL